MNVNRDSWHYKLWVSCYRLFDEKDRSYFESQASFCLYVRKCIYAVIMQGFIPIFNVIRWLFGYRKKIGITTVFHYPSPYWDVTYKWQKYAMIFLVWSYIVALPYHLEYFMGNAYPTLFILLHMLSGLAIILPIALGLFGIVLLGIVFGIVKFGESELAQTLRKMKQEKFCPLITFVGNPVNKGGDTG